jgi:hypothetical protein
MESCNEATRISVTPRTAHQIKDPGTNLATVNRGKFVLLPNHHATRYGKVDVQLHAFLTSDLDGGSHNVHETCTDMSLLRSNSVALFMSCNKIIPGTL